MQIIDLILTVLKLIQEYFDKLAKDKFNEDKENIEADPVDAFNERYGKLPNQQPEEMHGSNAKQPDIKMEQGQNGSDIKQG